MAGDDFLRQSLNQGNNRETPPITTGIVVDTDDTQQNLRLRVCCALLGDDPNPKTMRLHNIPWATYAPAFGGVSTQGYRGITSVVDGDVAYGLIGLPKVGTEVLVATVNGDPTVRMVIGCIINNGTSNTFPHGKYDTTGEYPDGPLAVNGTKIQPLYDNITQMFTGLFGSPRDSFEYMTRGVDYSHSAHRGRYMNSRQTTVDPDNVSISEADGNSIEYTAGHSRDRIGPQEEIVSNPNLKSDPQVVALVSPGLHAISMDDRAENCRLRIRTTSGHQIIFDDTNERIYLSSSKGKNWVEMDACGNIDIHSDTRISIHAAKDINLTAGDSVRITANNFHVRTMNETRLFSGGDTHLHSNANFRMHSAASTFLQTGATLAVKVATQANIEATNIDMLSSSDFKITSGATLHEKASNIFITGPHYVNSSNAAQAATAADPADQKSAYHTNRIPQHEPWPRVLTDMDKSDNDTESKPNSIDYRSNTLTDFEFKDYNDANIGRIERGVNLQRNQKWHR